jgi:hypothetical protein
MGALAAGMWRWTADSFERAGEAGVFGGAHADLIDGEVRVMSPQSPLHAFVLRVLLGALAGVGPSCSASVQSPVRLAADTELEPDVCIASGPQEKYAHRHPGPEDVLLVVEVAVTSLGFDAGEKLRTYARYGVPEVWVVDAGHRQVIVYSSPDRDQGVYVHVEVRATGGLEAWGLTLTVEQLWPPEADAQP